MSLDLIDLSSAGGTYRTAGTSKENTCSANLVRVRGLMKLLLSEERRLSVGTADCFTDMLYMFT